MFEIQSSDSPAREGTRRHIIAGNMAYEVARNDGSSVPREWKPFLLDISSLTRKVDAIKENSAVFRSGSQESARTLIKDFFISLSLEIEKCSQFHSSVETEMLARFSRLEQGVSLLGKIEPDQTENSHILVADMLSSCKRLTNELAALKSFSALTTSAVCRLLSLHDQATGLNTSAKFTSQHMRELPLVTCAEVKRMLLGCEELRIKARGHATTASLTAARAPSPTCSSMDPLTPLGAQATGVDPTGSSSSAAAPTSANTAKGEELERGNGAFSSRLGTGGGPHLHLPEVSDSSDEEFSLGSSVHPSTPSHVGSVHTSTATSLFVAPAAHRQGQRLPSKPNGKREPPKKGPGSKVDWDKQMQEHPLFRKRSWVDSVAMKPPHTPSCSPPPPPPRPFSASPSPSLAAVYRGHEKALLHKADQGKLAELRQKRAVDWGKQMQQHPLFRKPPTPPPPQGPPEETRGKEGRKAAPSSTTPLDSRQEEHFPLRHRPFLSSSSTLPPRKRRHGKSGPSKQGDSGSPDENMGPRPEKAQTKEGGERGGRAVLQQPAPLHPTGPSKTSLLSTASSVAGGEAKPAKQGRISSSWSERNLFLLAIECMNKEALSNQQSEDAEEGGCNQMRKRQRQI
mmetsp:Transcript_55859/g.104760  ORF Transcript_55859/g.104760 Transcript_55859/m.104760 type:complete len:626 (+) Transcript_55859:67-1944(+)